MFKGFSAYLRQVWNGIAQSYGGEESKPWMRMALLSMIVAAISLMVLLYSVTKTILLVKDVGELRVLSQEIGRESTEASIGGNMQAFNSLAKARNQFSDNLDTVVQLHGSSSNTMQGVIKTWGEMEQNIDVTLKSKSKVQELLTQTARIQESIPEVQAEYNLVVDQMVRNGAPASQVALTKNQLVILERVLRSVNSVLMGDNTVGDGSGKKEETMQLANDFGADMTDFAAYLNGQLDGDASLGVVAATDPAIRESLQTIKSYYDKDYKPLADNLNNNVEDVFKARVSAVNTLELSGNILTYLNKLANDVNGYFVNLSAFIFLVGSLGGLLYALWQLFKLRSSLDIEKVEQEAMVRQEQAEVEKERAKRIQEENQRNQMAILRLLDELGNLADGDLSINATVSEDFTGAIADSVNYAIDQLRILVSAINDTSIKVEESSQNTQQVAMNLAESSEMQAHEVEGVSMAISDMVTSIAQVSNNAAQSNQVARRSVEIARNGGDVVHRTIRGMDVIREQIQETSKRIKRLGESSQEIGDIVSLINDIADQTNILALNAAIQASMAGEAGRGFAVVADEVQRLAERSTLATKQIESLVKTIQSDTNEAVISMEQTTSEVVRGAKLAHDAGSALDEIQTVSTNLSELIYEITDASTKQSLSANQIANTMQVIRQITNQTTSGTISAASAVGKLATMATELRHSVSGFKLPDSMQK